MTITKLPPCVFCGFQRLPPGALNGHSQWRPACHVNGHSEARIVVWAIDMAGLDIIVMQFMEKGGGGGWTASCVRVYARVRLLGRESSTRGWGGLDAHPLVGGGESGLTKRARGGQPARLP